MGCLGCHSFFRVSLCALSGFSEFGWASWSDFRYGEPPRWLPSRPRVDDQVTLAPAVRDARGTRRPAVRGRFLRYFLPHSSVSFSSMSFLFSLSLSLSLSHLAYFFSRRTFLSVLLSSSRPPPLVFRLDVLSRLLGRWWQFNNRTVPAPVPRTRVRIRAHEWPWAGHRLRKRNKTRHDSIEIDVNRC